jgi:hypothetical protein
VIVLWKNGAHLGSGRGREPAARAEQLAARASIGKNTNFIFEKSTRWQILILNFLLTKEEKTPNIDGLYEILKNISFLTKNTGKASRETGEKDATYLQIQDLCMGLYVTTPEKNRTHTRDLNRSY